jgi:hypothetical protein
VHQTAGSLSCVSSPYSADDKSSYEGVVWHRPLQLDAHIRKWGVPLTARVPQVAFDKLNLCPQRSNSLGVLTGLGDE